MTSQPDWRHVARLMLVSRELERIELQDLVPQGKVRYQFCSAGHDLAQILLALSLDHRHDAAAVYYRSRAFLLGCGLTPTEALAGGMAKSGGLTEGREAGVMYSLPRRSGAAVLPSSGDVGTQFVIAAGWAQAVPYHMEALRDDSWEGALAVALGGDGSVASNGFWSSLNIAAVQKLPLLYFIEHNGHGISVPAAMQTPGGNIAENLASYKNLRIIQACGYKPQETWDAIQAAVTHVRSTGPCLLQLEVPRLSGHTFNDTQAYKTSAQKENDRARDPLGHLKEFVLSQFMDAEVWHSLEREAESLVAEALEDAERAPEPESGTVKHHVFFDGKEPLMGGLRAENAQLALGAAISHPEGPRINFLDAVKRTLEVELEKNPRMLIFGEDVGEKGGVHGATRDMQARFGKSRVFDTSLNEDGIIGRSVGLALAGLMPVPEIQFRKYADPAYEQLNDLGSLRWRTAGRFAAPVVVRMPVGYGKKSADPWHSVCGEVVFARMMGWRIAFPSHAEDAVGLLRTALRGDDPTIFLEHRALLDSTQGRRPYPGDNFCLPFGVAARLSAGTDLTVVSWGEMVHRCLEAATDFPSQVEILDLRTIVPWDREMVLDSVARTGRLLIVHEDTLMAGFGAEIAATVAEECLPDLDAPIVRLAVSDCLIPYSRPLMEEVLPSVEKIRQKMETLLAY